MHRIGRTGRAGREGRAFTIATPDDRHRGGGDREADRRIRSRACRSKASIRWNGPRMMASAARRAPRPRGKAAAPSRSRRAAKRPSDRRADEREAAARRTRGGARAASRPPERREPPPPSARAEPTRRAGAGAAAEPRPAAARAAPRADAGATTISARRCSASATTSRLHAGAARRAAPPPREPRRRRPRHERRRRQPQGHFTAFTWDDPLRLDDQLTEDERAIRDAAHDYCQDKLFPRVLMANRHETFDREIMTEMGEMGFLGATLDSHGCAGVNYVSLRADRARGGAGRFRLSLAPSPCSPRW